MSGVTVVVSRVVSVTVEVLVTVFVLSSVWVAVVVSDLVVVCELVTVDVDLLSMVVCTVVVATLEDTVVENCVRVV